MNITRALLFMTVLFASFALGGCAVETADRGVTYDSPGRTDRIGTQRISLVVELERDDGSKIPGVEVRVSSPNDEDQDISDQFGKANITLVLQERDGLDFFFTSKKQKIEWTRSVVSVPPGQDEIGYLFKVDKFGRVRLAEVSY
jgi:hypothetical protein